MKVENTFPPNYKEILAAFPACEKHKAIFCYGEVIYNPFNANVTPDLVAHESVHSIQQAKDPISWWKRYILDPVFRLHQEVPAYSAQYKAIRESKLPRKISDWYKQQFAFALSGELYGNMISYGEADSLIRNYGK